VIFSKLHHRVLISSPLSPSQKQHETKSSREQKNAAAFASVTSGRKITHFDHRGNRSEYNKWRQERKKSLLWMLWSFVRRPEIGPKHFGL